MVFLKFKVKFWNFYRFKKLGGKNLGGGVVVNLNELIDFIYKNVINYFEF